MLFLVIIVNQYQMFIWAKNWNIYSHKTKIHHCLHQADLCKVKKFSELVTNLIQFFTYSHISSNSKFWSTFHWRISLRIAKNSNGAFFPHQQTFHRNGLNGNSHRSLTTILTLLWYLSSSFAVYWNSSHIFHYFFFLFNTCAYILRKY